MTKDQMRSIEEALDFALEALQYIHEGANNQGPHTGISWRCVAVKAEPAIKAIKQARSAPVQEPVAWVLTAELDKRETTTSAHLWFSDPVNCMWTPVYTAPPAAQRQWVGLTEWEVIEMKAAIAGTLDVQFINFARAIEAKLKTINGFHSTEKDT